MAQIQQNRSGTSSNREVYVSPVLLGPGFHQRTLVVVDDDGYLVLALWHLSASAS